MNRRKRERGIGERGTGNSIKKASEYDIEGGEIEDNSFWNNS